MHNLWVKLCGHTSMHTQCMDRTNQLRGSPLSAPQLPYSWVGSAFSCIIMAHILPLSWSLLAFWSPVLFLKCHVSTDPVFWASVSINSGATLWRPVVHRFICVALSFVSALPFTLWLPWVVLNTYLKFYLHCHIYYFKHFLPSSFSFIDRFVLQIRGGVWGDWDVMGMGT